MSKDCSICHCADTIVFGMVENNRKMPVGNVNVYARSRQWEPMTTTNAFGQYTLQGICLMGENLVFKKDQFMESTCSPSMRNFTHWICDVTLNQTGEYWRHYILTYLQFNSNKQIVKKNKVMQKEQQQEQQQQLLKLDKTVIQVINKIFWLFSLGFYTCNNMFYSFNFL